MSDKQNQQNEQNVTEQKINPKHYHQNGMETVDAMEAFFTSGKSHDIHLSQAFKYMSRAGDKQEPQEDHSEAYLRDLKKARWWLDRAITQLEE